MGKIQKTIHKNGKVVGNDMFTKKGCFVADHLFKIIKNLNLKKEKRIVVFWSSASTILPAMIKYTIVVHNG